MVPPPLLSTTSPPFFFSLAATLSQHVPNLSHLAGAHRLAKRADGHGHKHDGAFVAGAILMPVLVILSGIFAGLTLGYMSLDETQLHVLSISGTPYVAQFGLPRLYANFWWHWHWTVDSANMLTKSSPSARMGICCLSRCFLRT